MSFLFGKSSGHDALRCTSSFSSKGFKETSVLEIVETARFSKTTFY
ncbi:TetR/AcrR family transcriptional regulator [Fictibacillus sp. KIGAM418]|uniref:TetR/AcrR family transcriptional regulator n=1 Tax=Fictibacillus marinisediminis TaxID=2878389 RepID=A0A9X2BFI9_9BACL|nr:TetR/AcrR family transcriptional regulator [Fictibacillus marinisediminis]